MQFLKERLPTIGETFLPAWGWIAGILILGILGTAQAIHDEILPPETTERYYLSHWLPDIDWKWYVLAILAAIILFLVESAHRAIAISKKVQVIGERYKTLFDKPRADGAYMLGAVAVKPITNWNHNGGRQCSLQCSLEITTTVAIQYYVSRFEASSEGINCPNLPEAAKLGIATPIDSKIVRLPFAGKMPWTKNKSWRGAAKYTLRYGLLIGPSRYPYRIDCELDLEVREGRSMQTVILESRTKI